MVMRDKSCPARPESTTVVTTQADQQTACAKYLLTPTVLYLYVLQMLSSLGWGNAFQQQQQHLQLGLVYRILYIPPYTIPCTIYSTVCYIYTVTASSVLSSCLMVVLLVHDAPRRNAALHASLPSLK